MFGAGIGVGMRTFATAEPRYHVALVGGTSIGMTRNGMAGEATSGAGQKSLLFVMLGLILHGFWSWAMAVLIVVCCRPIS
ncbi:hypothetical protein DL1_17020 [Thioclava dalianensis]|uniref:Uncharacterized protein n=1 Tax=Thioclava dalianensis TaxID=1185766 RepID=A0A074TFX5_9RHOB|nr:hypothetical protein [Thioclava dalianensis]KEP67948.1 hypothetical protein DL1_17020 [Thioclava dalianensis]SFN59690.1 hypothetical protein SAMN05216224_107170 [Thioclava dalianensis]